MEDDLSIFWVYIWNWHGKLGGGMLFTVFDTGLRYWDTMEDDLSIFWVYIWKWHGKLGRLRFLRFSFIGAFVSELCPVEVYRNLYFDPL